MARAYDADAGPVTEKRTTEFAGADDDETASAGPVQDVANRGAAGARSRNGVPKTITVMTAKTNTSFLLGRGTGARRCGPSAFPAVLGSGIGSGSPRNIDLVFSRRCLRAVSSAS